MSEVIENAAKIRVEKYLERDRKHGREKATKYKRVADLTPEEYERRKAVWARAYAKRKAIKAGHSSPRKKLTNIQHIKRRMYFHTRSSAKARGLEHSIEIDDIVLPEICPILKKPLNYGEFEHNKNMVPSLDRIDSTKGYIKGNVQVISWRANSLKNNATDEELALLGAYAFEQLAKKFKQPA